MDRVYLFLALGVALSGVGFTQTTQSAPSTPTTLNSTVAQSSIQPRTTVAPSTSVDLNCGENERETNCLPCEQRCDSAVRNITSFCFNKRCFNNGPKFCECPIDQGFARDSNGKCVAASSCPIPGCPTGQQWSEAVCDGTCEVPQPNCSMFDCNSPGCACKQGYARFAGYCIPAALCPPKKNDRCGECPAGQICKRSGGLFNRGRPERKGEGECVWFNPCAFRMTKLGPL